jgi:hypothetical protein
MVSQEAQEGQVMLCRKCGVIISGDWGKDYEYHLPCWPEFEAVPGMHGMSPYDLGLKDDLINIVRWSANNSTRSQQVALGCSEVGHSCDRRIAYRMAGIAEPNNWTDPWPAVVGTSIHSWMEQAVNDYQHVHGIKEWLTEMEVLPNPLVMGHTDLFHLPSHAVLDWKFPSPDNVKKMRQSGPSQQYMTQVHLYGLGHVNAGRKVERVGIVALGRQGWLKDMYVHTVPFDQSVAEKAIQRIYDIGAKLIESDILNNPKVWRDIPSQPDRLCTYCPWYRSGITVDEKGCGGL